MILWGTVRMPTWFVTIVPPTLAGDLPELAPMVCTRQPTMPSLTMMAVKEDSGYGTLYINVTTL